jgi:hypothetical protein
MIQAKLGKARPMHLNKFLHRSDDKPSKKNKFKSKKAVETEEEIKKEEKCKGDDIIEEKPKEMKKNE